MTSAIYDEAGNKAWDKLMTNHEKRRLMYGILSFLSAAPSKI
jgi:hypothetical protein